MPLGTKCVSALSICVSMTSLGTVTSVNALDLGCTSASSLSKLRSQMAVEGQIPVLQFYAAIKDMVTGKVELREHVISMNPSDGTGHRMFRDSDGGMCVVTNMRDMRLFSNLTGDLDKSSLLPLGRANAYPTGVNRVIFGMSVEHKQFPLLRARELLEKNQEYYIYLLADASGRGGIVAASLDGSYEDHYSKGIPNEQTAAVKYGARLTSSGEIILRQSSANALGKP